MILAILQAQLRSMRTFRTGGNAASTIVNFLTGFLFYGFWAAVAFGAQAFLANPRNAQYFPLVLPSALLLVLLYWQITPVVTASMGASIDLKKLLSYPIPHEKLFIVEVLLRLTTCAEMILVLLGIGVGLARNPGTGGVPRILTATLLFILFNLLLSAGMRSFLERLLQTRRLRELFFLLMIGIGVGPQYLIRTHFKPQTLTDRLPDAPWLPTHLFLGPTGALPWLVLIGAVVLAYAFSRWQFAVSLRFDGSTAKAPSKTLTGLSRLESLYRLPGRFLQDPVAAIVEKELRSLLRTPPFRMIFLMSAVFGFLLWLPHMIARTPNGDSKSFMAQNIMVFLTTYGILMLGQVTYFNSFGFDRSATQAWFSFPVTIRRALIGKNLTALVFIMVQIVLVSILGIFMASDFTPGKFLETCTVSLIAALYLVAFGNITSVRIPRPLNPDKVNQGGSAKAMNAVIIMCFPVVLLPIALAYWARHVFSSQPIFYALLTLAAALGALLYWLGLTSATATANSTREKILTNLSRGEGPLSLS